MSTLLVRENKYNLNNTLLLLFHRVSILTVVSLGTIANADFQCENSNPHISPNTSHLQDNNGTVIDSKTDLIWKKCSEGQSWNPDTNVCDGVVNSFTWQQAFQQVQAVNNSTAEQNLGLGYSDWRLPNIKELTSILEFKCWSPAINASVFPAMPMDGKFSLYWTSTQRAGTSGEKAWMVNFGFGDNGSFIKNTIFKDFTYFDDNNQEVTDRGFFYVRLVRTGLE